MNVVLTMIDSVSQMMDFILNLVYFILKMVNFNECCINNDGFRITNDGFHTKHGVFHGGMDRRMLRVPTLANKYVIKLTKNRRKNSGKLVDKLVDN